jgi:hypothetical protein
LFPDLGKYIGAAVLKHHDGSVISGALGAVCNTGITVIAFAIVVEESLAHVEIGNIDAGYGDATKT